MRKVLVMEEKNDFVVRPLYMDRIRPYIGKSIIKILVGQRRVGKSYILKAVADEVRRLNPDANFISINLEDFAFAHITDAATLHSEIQSRIVAGCKNFIFLDEIQEVADFDRVVRSLLLDSDNDIYITGSNSSMLSSEMASRLAGRSIEIYVHPLTYSEFLDFHSYQDSDESVQAYLRYGGMPYLRNLPNRNTWDEYLSGVTDAVVYRDVVSRQGLRNTDFLQRLMLYLADNVGNIFTAKKIADYLKSQRIASSTSGVQSYIEYLEDAFIVNRARRWDIVGKRFFEIGEKIYFEDLGIRNAIIGYRPNDIGGLLENAVFNHLQSRGYRVSVGAMPRGREIDFIAEKDNEYRYIQVALTIVDPTTAVREFGNLEKIPDNYEKTVITLRDDFPNTVNGIYHQSLRKFLLS